MEYPHFNRKYIFKGSIFHCYVRLPECNGKYPGPFFFVVFVASPWKNMVLWCPRKLGSMVSKWVISPTYKWDINWGEITHWSDHHRSDHFQRDIQVGQKSGTNFKTSSTSLWWWSFLPRPTDVLRGFFPWVTGPFFSVAPFQTARKGNFPPVVKRKGEFNRPP